MPKVRDIVRIIEDFAPLALQCEFDNSGLVYGDLDKEVGGVLITLDTNPDVVTEAAKRGCDMIIEHHPTLFHPLKKFDFRLPVHRALCEAIRQDIAIYSAHTTVDFATNGLNDRLAAKLGCRDIQTVDGTPFSARIGRLPKTYTLAGFAAHIANVLGDGNTATVGDPDMPVNVVAIANGAGGGSEEAVLQAKAAGADIFVTSELKYNVVRLAKDINYGIISVGHYDSEIGFAELVCNLPNLKGLGIPVFRAESLKNPFNDRRRQ